MAKQEDAPLFANLSFMQTVIGDIVTPTGILPGGALVIDDEGRIAEILAVPRSPHRSGDTDASGYLVLPGFLDMHVHGGGGADFMHGTVEAIRQVARTHARFGTTGLLATTLTASHEATDAAIIAARTVMEQDRDRDEARILGIHLEGPYICLTKRGAQPEAFVRPPDISEFQHWVRLSGGNVRQITLAPELEGAEALVRVAREANIIASIGHTDAKASDVLAAIGWGATQATHLFNAMRGVHHREPGTVGTALAQPEIVTEMIADGVHLDPLIVRLIVAAKGIEGAVLITDAIEGAAMPDGDYELGGHTVLVQHGTAAFPDGTLAGSVLTMNRAFMNALRFAEVSPVVGTHLAAGNAARQLGIDTQVSKLKEGFAADLAILHPISGEVAWTMIGGQIAYQR